MPAAVRLPPERNRVMRVLRVLALFLLGLSLDGEEPPSPNSDAGGMMDPLG
jgi:hypothetical protein